ncbi:MAG: DUF5721 family protein [Firmicutes bacterium]|nr:DUF5721 family protein [Bacillota bacterium]
MLVFEMSGAEVKTLMNRLLKEDVFDKFEVRGAEVCGFTKFTASGILDKTALPDGDKAKTPRSYCLWSELRPYVYDWVRGGRTPRSMKIIFSLGDEAVAKAHGNAAAMFLNLNFEEGTARFTTATAQKTFTMDKTVDQIWDQKILNFFKKYFPAAKIV